MEKSFRYKILTNEIQFIKWTDDITGSGYGINAMLMVMMSMMIKMAGKVTCPVSVKGEKMTVDEKEGRRGAGRGITAYHRSPRIALYGTTKTVQAEIKNL